MRVLGAVLAGGASRRFGSDKALATYRGKTLIAHVVDRLRPQVDDLIVVGRDYPGLPSIRDRPSSGLGPLAGLNAALNYAAVNDFNAVLTSGCDLPHLPTDLRRRLGDGPAVARGQPLLGLWPSELGPSLDAYLDRVADRSLNGWTTVIGAATVDFGPIVNVNTVTDLPD